MDDLSKVTFPGQQEGEKVLSVITPHKLTFSLEYTKLILVSFFLLIAFLSLGKVSVIFSYVSFPLSLSTLIIGFYLYRSIHTKRIAYITNRRIVRFEPSNSFVVNSRSLTWDNVIKVKTFSPTFYWRLKNIGTVIIHSKTTSTNINNTNQVYLANDDVILKNVEYYKDLGNYIDKVLYLFANDKKELNNIHAFVNKPKWHRY